MFIRIAKWLEQQYSCQIVDSQAQLSDGCKVSLREEAEDVAITIFSTSVEVAVKRAMEVTGRLDLHGLRATIEIETPRRVKPLDVEGLASLCKEEIDLKVETAMVECDFLAGEAIDRLCQKPGHFFNTGVMQEIIDENQARLSNIEREIGQMLKGQSGSPSRRPGIDEKMKRQMYAIWSTLDKLSTASQGLMRSGS
jgi:hypothetical protein